MKDLYLRLGINQNASAEEIAAALENRPEMRADSQILLREDKRSVYDRTYTTLRAIGTLRQRLGLAADDTWFNENYPDFVPGLRAGISSASSGNAPPAETGPEDSEVLRKHASVAPEPPTRSKWLIPVLIGIAVAVLLILIFEFF